MKVADIDRNVEKSFERKILSAVAQKFKISDFETFFRANLNTVRDMLMIRLLKGRMNLKKRGIEQEIIDDDDDDFDNVAVATGTASRKRSSDGAGEKVKTGKRRRPSPPPSPSIIEQTQEMV